MAVKHGSNRNLMKKIALLAANAVVLVPVANVVASVANAVAPVANTMALAPVVDPS